MITNKKIQEVAEEVLGSSVYVSECVEYGASVAETYNAIKISSPEYVIKFFHKKYKSKSREYAFDILRALLPEAMRRTVIEALKIAENLSRNKEVPDHIDADRYEAARKALTR